MPSFQPRIPAGVRRVFRLPLRTRAEIRRDLDEEVQFHLEMRIADLLAGGMSPEAARAEALRRFGDAEEARRYCEALDRKRVRLVAVREGMSAWGQDLRYAGRQMLAHPGFTLVAAITLALGIGANTAIFSVLNHLVLHPLPYAGADRLVAIFRSNVKTPSVMLMPMAQDVVAWRQRTRTLQHIEGMTGEQLMYATSAGSEEINAEGVSPGLFALLGTHPAIGRGFTEGDTRPGAAPVVIITDGFWRERFGGARDVIGKALRLDEQMYTIVGIMPPGIDVSLVTGSGGARVLTPVDFSPDARQRRMGMLPVARLAPGATIEAAQRELVAISKTIPGPRFLADWGVVVQQAGTRRGSSLRTGLFVLLGAVGLVLLIACANVANLLLAKGLVREREFAVRAALGAGRGRLVRQLLTESGTLALLGGALGMAVAWSGLRSIIAFRPSSLEQLDGARLEPVVLAWTLGITLLTGLLFGIAPALHLGAHEMADALRAGGRSSLGASSRRFRAALVTVEIALSVVLLVGAGLLVRSVIRLQRVNVGFDMNGLVSMELAVGPATTRYSSAGQRRLEEVGAGLEERVRHLGGVAAVTRVSTAPPSFSFMLTEFAIDAHPLDDASRPRELPVYGVRPNYFSVMRIPVIEGRSFGIGDASQHVAVISRATAHRFWPGESAVGHRFRIGDDKEPWIRVIGVVGDVSGRGPLDHSADDMQFYQLSDTGLVAPTLVVRARGDPAAIVPAVRRELVAIDRGAALTNVAVVRDAMVASIARPRFTMVLLAIFAGVALLLSTIGLYGVIAYAVSQRTREIGVRVALGARPQDVVRLVLTQGLTLALIGIALGLVGAVGATRALRSLLFEIQPGDPATFLVVGAMLTTVALVASYVPARRAAGIDPVEALRAEG